MSAHAKFANAALFHVPSQALPRGVLFASNPHGHDEKGWNRGRYGVYTISRAGASTCRPPGSSS